MIHEADDRAACRSLMCGGSRTFFAASRLLPRRVYEPATALYAFCRLADDAIDEGGCKIAALASLSDRLASAYSGTPAPFAADRAFAAAVLHHAIPRVLPEALLEGFAWDSQGRRYENLSDLHDYAARVAGTVGAMMAVLMSARSSQALARACDLGIAMQLTNIARDVGEDARAGRLYLPLAWMREAGVDPDEWLRRPLFNPAIASVVQRLLRSADELYAQAACGISLLPVDCRPGIRAAGLIYAAIGQRIAQHGHDSVSQRARVSGARKTVLVMRSLDAVLPGWADARVPALEAVGYLVDAAVCESAPLPHRFRPAQALDARVTWLFELFERLGQAQMETP